MKAVLIVAAVIGVSGTVVYLYRARKLGDWPFAITPPG